jgi:PleD family two-component response regulator
MVELGVTLTFGVAAFAEPMELAEVVKQGDLVLYEGQRAGKNRVVAVNSSRPPEGLTTA